jgi:ATP-dependent Lhr-like helicase
MRKFDAGQEAITLSAADPLNLVGILVPGERVPAISGNSVTFRDGASVVTGVPSPEYRAETA